MLLNTDSVKPSIPENSCNPLWQQLVEHKKDFSNTSIAQLFEQDSDRTEQFSLKSSGLLLDYSKNLITEQTRRLLTDLARQAGLQTAIESMFRGDVINQTEGRSVLHVALRGGFQDNPKIAVNTDIQNVQDDIRKFVEQIESHQWRGYSGLPITDIVNIGVGGSDLGPRMVYEALSPYQNPTINIHFLANIDGSDFTNTVHGLSPETTLFIIASKSFSTLETRKNAEAARSWFIQQGGTEPDLAKHFVAVSSNVDAAVEFGIAQDQVFPMWEWVGGRYSLWSAIGLPLALGLGYENFKALCGGAHQMDQHFLTADFEQNMPVLLAMLEIWYQNYFGAHTHAVIPYDHNLRHLPEFLQQLDMESNGKSIGRSGQSITYNTGAVVWGGSGTIGQHSFHQLLHQGTQLIPVDFIVPLRSHNPVADHHSHLVSNALAQSRALMQGKTLEEVRSEMKGQGLDSGEIDRLAPHKVVPGNRPNNMLLMNYLEPSSLGALIALYEQKVYVQSVVWDINAFDQWGVELGKQLSQTIHPQLVDPDLVPDFDSSTNRLIELFKKGKI
ncbi:MAG: glucose-6-phosphate isomerase [Pseudomonadales bacterium]|nr:glucose-6-phosphate isomerase [Pseudomonadales bacterium]